MADLIDRAQDAGSGMIGAIPCWMGWDEAMRIYGRCRSSATSERKTKSKRKQRRRKPNRR